MPIVDCGEATTVLHKIKRSRIVIRRVYWSNATYLVVRLMGFLVLATFLVLRRDFTVSIEWVFGYVGVSAVVAVALVKLKFGERFPKLNGYLLYPGQGNETDAFQSAEDWTRNKAAYLESGFRRAQIIFAPAEDALICVPILLAGIDAMTASIGGLAFGLMHLGRFTYLECIGKSIIYGLVCYFILPHGLLTVVLGHLVLDAMGWLLLKVYKATKRQGE